MIVQGKSKHSDDADELSREFKRDFTLPNNVDQYSIKAQLDEGTRQLQLIGKVARPAEVAESKLPHVHLQSTRNDVNRLNAKIGTTKETRINNTFVEYEIFLGNELVNGKVSLDLSGYNDLIVKVVQNDLDNFGDLSLELKRNLKLPYGADSHNIEHGIDGSSATLFIKVPIQSR